MESVLLAMEGLYSFLYLYEDKITISPKKFGRNILGTIVFTIGNPVFNQTRTIYINTITAIYVKHHGLFAGSIQFVVPGADHGHRPGINSPTTMLSDGNTFSFVNGKVNNALADKLKSLIERIRSNYKQPVIKTQENDPDIIRKYKQLYDDGIITEEEYQKKKKEILGV